jgi:hypothetical protein
VGVKKVPGGSDLFRSANRKPGLRLVNREQKRFTESTSRFQLISLFHASAVRLSHKFDLWTIR